MPLQPAEQAVLNLQAVRLAISLEADDVSPSKEALIESILNSASPAEADWFTNLDVTEVVGILGLKSSPYPNSLKIGTFSYRTRQDVKDNSPVRTGTGEYYLVVRDRAEVSPFVGKRAGSYAVFLKYAGGNAQYIMDRNVKVALLRKL